jgi:hypothetical protein
MRVLVSGDRNWSDRDYIFYTLDGVSAVRPISSVIQGKAPGADHFAKLWARHNHLACLDFEADWDTYGKAAGPIRNKQMLDEGKPDMVIAFHEDILKSKGTKDMLKQASRAGVPWLLFPLGINQEGRSLWSPHRITARGLAIVRALAPTGPRGPVGVTGAKRR